ncbi:hypothetical protein [Devosia sp. Root635]|uniref:hypothetical protein n=1 Tax=Devosia sp. Root635 TaxID=1736575 RepID=UPI0012E379A2|nr:hypothetical protein [Devosia sp. Root635]
MLSFLCTAQFWAETAKLIAQLGGALLIAWLTVRWALGRYKSEKMWEREAAAMFDVLGAIADMKDVNSEWLNQLLRDQNAEEMINADAGVEAERDAALLSRWRDAKRRLDGVSAVASVVLSPKAEEALGKLNASLSRPFEDYIDDLTSTDTALRTARATLIGIGRGRFGVNDVRL